MSNNFIYNKYFLKAIFIKYIFLATIMCYLIAINSNFLTICSFIIPVFLLNFSTPLILKNYFILYSSLLFFVGGSFFFPDVDYIKIHGIVIISFFSGGYYISSLLFKNKNFSSNFFKENDNFYAIKVKILQKGITVFFCLRLLLITIKISQAGFFNYFSGSTLVDSIGAYGKGDFNRGINDILDSFLASVHIVFTILYIVYVFRLRKKINYLYLSLPFIVIPLLSLSRNSFAFGLILMLIIYSIYHRNYGKINKKVFLLIFTAFFSLLIVGVTIGDIRESKIASNEDTKDMLLSVYGELSPIVQYNNLNNKINELHYQFGYTIFPPLIFKVVPRSWYPEKPINSTAYYSLRYEKDSFNEGFMIPSTIYGDLFLNFGLYFSLIIFSILGFLVRRLDLIYLTSNIYNLQFFLLVYLNFYGLLRNNLPEGLFPLIQGFILYYILNAIINSITEYRIKNEKK